MVRGRDSLMQGKIDGADSLGNTVSAWLHLAPLLYTKHCCSTSTIVTTRLQDIQYGKEAGKSVHACEELSCH